MQAETCDLRATVCIKQNVINPLWWSCTKACLKLTSRLVDLQMELNSIQDAQKIVLVTLVEVSFE